MEINLTDVIIQIITYAIPLLLAVGVGCVLIKVKETGNDDKLKKALAIAETVIPILITLYKELCKTSPELIDKSDEIAKWFKEYITKLIPLSNEELDTLWKMCLLKITEEFKKAGYDIEFKSECNFAEIPMECNAIQFTK